MLPVNPTLKDRLISKTIFDFDTGCWLWTGAHWHDGYGEIGNHHGKIVSTHRLAWELEYGKIPQGMCVLHKCDNPSCVNISHLFLGTIRDNAADKMSKNRQSRVSHKLSKQDAHTIKELLKNPHRGLYAEIEKRFNISLVNIKRIKAGAIWKTA